MRNRIVLVHVVRHSIAPIMAAFARLWPEAEVLNLFDEALVADNDESGTMTPALYRRVARLFRYAAVEAGADGVIFTGSAFAPAIESGRGEHDIPILLPHEAMIERALDLGRRIGCLCVSARSIPVMEGYVRREAERRGLAVSFAGRHVAGAFDVSTHARHPAHDRMVAEAADGLADCDVLLIAQMSMATAAPQVRPVRGRTVLTSPDAAVAKLKRLLTE